MLLRKLFGEKDQVAEWARIRSAYASRLLAIEVGRVIDRARLAGDIDDEQVADLQAEFCRVLRSIDLRPMTEAVPDEPPPRCPPWSELPTRSIWRPPWMSRGRSGND